LGILDGELIGWVEISGMMMILTGVWLVNTRKRAIMTSKEMQKTPSPIEGTAEVNIKS